MNRRGPKAKSLDSTAARPHAEIGYPPAVSTQCLFFVAYLK